MSDKNKINWFDSAQEQQQKNNEKNKLILCENIAAP